MSNGWGLGVADWDDYVRGFHTALPGVTERVLRRARCDGLDPYQWCAAALGRGSAVVLDLACGSGPLAVHVSGWVGVDRSRQELQAARAAGRGPLVEANALRLPFPARAFSTAAVAMALQVVVPLREAIAELSRVTRGDAIVSVLLPGRRPLSWRDVVFYWRLQRRLDRSIAYPNDRLLERHRLGPLLAEHGFAVVDDESRAFRVPLATRDDADEFLRSLYLPKIPPARIRTAAELLRGRVGNRVTIPLRRIVLRRSGCDP